MVLLKCCQIVVLEESKQLSCMKSGSNESKDEGFYACSKWPHSKAEWKPCCLSLCCCTASSNSCIEQRCFVSVWWQDMTVSRSTCGCAGDQNEKKKLLAFITSAALNWVAVVWSFVSLLRCRLVFQMSALFDCLLITFSFTTDLLMLLLLVHKRSTGIPVGGMFW